MSEDVEIVKSASLAAQKALTEAMTKSMDLMLTGYTAALMIFEDYRRTGNWIVSVDVQETLLKLFPTREE